MAQLPLAAFASPATNPCSWLLGLSVGCLSDIYCAPSIIDDDAIGTMDGCKCAGQLEVLQKCEKWPLLGKRGAEMVAAPKKKMCLPAAKYCQGHGGKKRKEKKMASI